MSNKNRKTTKGKRIQKKRTVKRLTNEQKAIREIRKAERQALADFNTELRYVGLIAVQKTWYMPRFKKLVKASRPYLSKLADKLNAMRKENAWLNA